MEQKSDIVGKKCSGQPGRYGIRQVWTSRPSAMGDPDQVT